MTIGRLIVAFTLAATLSATASATTRWIITDRDMTVASSTATEQAAQKARAEESCYLPALPRQCTPKKGAWTCVAENPTRPSDCAKRGRWKRAVAPA